MCDISASRAGSGPICRPIQGIGQRGRRPSLTIQVGQRQEIVSLDILKAHTISGPVSPAGAVCSNTVKAPNFDRVFMKNMFFLHILVG
jgi:hypothetical protein